jgi:S-adenosylmethionine synthetase
MSYLFTSESVSEGHPDKVCDQISDAVLDALLAQDKTSRVACESFVTTGLAIVGGEITTNGYIEIQDIVRQVIREIGYTKAEYRFDADSCSVLSAIHSQSPDIAQGVDTGGAGRSSRSSCRICGLTRNLRSRSNITAASLFVFIRW